MATGAQVLASLKTITRVFALSQQVQTFVLIGVATALSTTLVRILSSVMTETRFPTTVAVPRAQGNVVLNVLAKVAILAVQTSALTYAETR